jgi:peptidoglycan hydrolase CwlO-like protein
MAKIIFAKRLSVFVLSLTLSGLFAFAAGNILAEQLIEEANIQQMRDEISRLQQEIEGYTKSILESQKKGKTLQSEIALFENKIKKAQAQIKSIGVAIKQLEGEIKQTEGEINEASKSLDAKKQILAAVMNKLDCKERTPFFEVLAANDSFFDFFNDLYAMNDIRDEIKRVVLEIKSAKQKLENRKADLNEKYDDQFAAKNLLEISKQTLQRQESQKKNLLRETKGLESRFQQLLSLSKKNLGRLKSELSFLLKAGISAEDALKYGQAVANGIGLRPAFLLAILEIESHLGANVGTGTYKKDMNPNQWSYFLKITSRLGLDPDKTPVSKKPNYGWGGAMGPAQFLPGTWLGWEPKIITLTGHQTPSPWGIEDSFTAAALKLYNDGALAKTTAGELKAAKAYISGNPNCSKSICNYYANLAIDKAAEIEETLKNK